MKTRIHFTVPSVDAVLTALVLSALGVVGMVALASGSVRMWFA